MRGFEAVLSHVCVVGGCYKVLSWCELEAKMGSV